MIVPRMRLLWLRGVDRSKGFGITFHMISGVFFFVFFYFQGMISFLGSEDFAFFP